MPPFPRFPLLASTLLLTGLLMGFFAPAGAMAQNSAVAPMIRLIEGGKLPESRLPTVLGLVCKRGDAEDLRFVFERAIAADGFSPENQQAALELLAQTTRDRNLKPAGDLTQLKQVLEQATTQKNVQLQQQVIQLVGVWQVREMATDLSQTLKAGASPQLAGSILETLAKLGGEDATRQIEGLTAPGNSAAIRIQAITALTGLDLEKAAQAAAVFLKQASGKENLDAMVQAFLARQKGPELLGQAVAKQKIPADTAKMVLRSMLTAGRNDEALSNPLSEAAGLNNSMEPLTPQELETLVQEVLAKGDAARGEHIFRREELNCYKCHAIGKAGANIGPDLSPVGGSSPIDYLINSLLLPSQAIKEAYKTVLVIDIDGLSHTGIVVDQDDDRMILRDAQGKEKTIAIDDIEFEKEGDSLMPAGLTKFLTHQEFVDLLRYLSALGKDPGYIMSADPTVYRWRVYRGSPAKVTGELFDDDSVRNMLFEYAPQKWQPLYSLASGALPLAEAKQIAGSPVIFAYAELDVTVAGNIQLNLPSPEGITFWLDDQRISPAEWNKLQVSTGQHRLLFRIDTKKYPQNSLTATITKGAAPAAEYSIAVGQ